MVRREPIQPIEDDGTLDKTCSMEPINPKNAILTLKSVCILLGIDPSIHSLSKFLGSKEPILLRDLLMEGTWIAIKPKSYDTPKELIQAMPAIKSPTPPFNSIELPLEAGHLIAPLRLAAQMKEPLQILTEAVLQYDNNISLANALADLAVSGRSSYEKFLQNPVTDSILVSNVKTRINDINGGNVSISEPEITNAAKNVLDRAYKAAFALRGPYPEQAAVRNTLGWIAVSGEDDPPHRPVNAGAAPFQQYEISVPVNHPAGSLDHSPTSVYSPVSVKTRFFIASQPVPANQLSTKQITLPERSLPLDNKPVIPDGDQVILFIHGHSSRAEEALLVTKYIHEYAQIKGNRYSVICMDLPSNGYSEMIEHTQVAPSNATTYPDEPWPDTTPFNTPLLDFLEDFIISFVDKLDSLTPVKNRFAGIIGGSLGGNMGLRLGRRDLSQCTWLTQAGIISWSPASVWGPFAQNYFKSRAPGHCAEKWDELEDAGMSLNSNNLQGVGYRDFSRYNHFAQVYYNIMYKPDGSFCDNNLFDEIAMLFGPSQASSWHRPGWACGDEVFLLSIRDRCEVYNERFRRWHWRVAGEQLIYSHFYRVDWRNNQTPIRYELNKVRQLLIAGDNDNGPLTKIYDSTQKLAELMTNTPGDSMFLLNTGHSIHDERPAFLAQQIVNFLL